jgi:hypothetical protein
MRPLARSIVTRYPLKMLIPSTPWIRPCGSNSDVVVVTSASENVTPPSSKRSSSPRDDGVRPVPPPCEHGLLRQRREPRLLDRTRHDEEPGAPGVQQQANLLLVRERRLHEHTAAR